MRSAPARILIAVGMLCSLAFAEVGMRVVEPSVPPPSQWPTVETEVKSRQVADLERAVDLLFLGTSVTEAAVDPALLMTLTGDEAVYNAALPFATPLSDEVWLEEVLLRELAPSMVVIGMPVWPAHTTLGTDPLRTGLELAVAADTLPTSVESSALVSNRGVLADWDQRRTRQRLAASGTWSADGHMMAYYDSPFSSLEGAFPPYGRPSMSSDNAVALRQTIRDLIGTGTEVVLMVEPGHYPGQVSDSEINSYVRSMEGLAAELGVELWDTHSVDWDPAFFVDEAHFNRDGTVAFTTYLASLLGGSRRAG